MMRILFIFVLGTLLSGGFVQAAENQTVERYFTHKIFGDGVCAKLILQGDLLQVAKFKYWLGEIAGVDIGRQTLLAIAGSGHTLTIRHAGYARFSAGRTIAPMTENLINGIGESVEIVFDATITERGSHMVFNARKEMIEYGASVNLFHELVHARHQMMGTWRYFDSEGQAIEEENRFRLERGQSRGEIITERASKAGVPIESVTGGKRPSPRFYHVRTNPPPRPMTTLELPL